MASPPLARERMGRILERWFLTDPLLFSLWNDHQVNIAPVATMRVGSGVIAYNPAFIDALSPTELEAVMRCEAVRILLKHPYSRQLFPPQIAWRASNLTLREHLGTLPLPFLTAFDVFGHHQHDRQFYEFYHHRLLEQADQPPPPAPGGAAGNSARLRLMRQAAPRSAARHPMSPKLNPQRRHWMNPASAHRRRGLPRWKIMPIQAGLVWKIPGNGARMSCSVSALTSG